MEDFKNQAVDNTATVPTTEPVQQQNNIEEIVKQMFEQGLEVEEIMSTLKSMFDEQKISEEELQKGVELVNQMDKQLASKQFGVNIL